MDLRDELIREHSKAQTLRIISYIGDNKSLFSELMGLFLANEPILSQRASWPLAYIAVAQPELVLPYQYQLITNIKQLNNHDAIRRNTLRIWIDVMPAEDNWGELFDICYSFLRSKNEPNAIKSFAMHVMSNIVVKYPELKNELQSIIEDLLPLGKPAITSRGLKTLKLLNKI
jgi:hypothetical protein